MRSRWGLGDKPIKSVVDILESKGIKVYRTETTKHFDGFTTIDETYPIICVNTPTFPRKPASKKSKPLEENWDIPRLRHTYLHEYAHPILKFTGVSARDIERHCSRFAGALLLPKSALLSRYNSTGSINTSALIEIKEEFGISIASIVMRLKQCSLISADNEKYFFIKYRQFGYGTRIQRDSET